MRDHQEEAEQLFGNKLRLKTDGGAHRRVGDRIVSRIGLGCVRQEARLADPAD